MRSPHKKILKKFSWYYLQARIFLFSKRNAKVLERTPRFSKVTIEITRNDIGFFAFLNWFLYLTKYLESIHLQPDIVLKNRCYGSPVYEYNIISGRFYKENIGHMYQGKSAIRIKIKSAEEILPNMHLGIAEANAIQRRTLIPSLRLTEIVNSFISTEISGDFFSIHWRGTDKVSEAQPISVEYILKVLGNLMENRTIVEKTCFIASDEEAKIIELKNEIKRSFPNLKVVYLRNALRSPDSAPMHLDRKFSKFEAATLGDEALIECLILAQSSFLIKTTSFLSAWSVVFNPNIPVFYLNTPYPNKVWFPDSELLGVRYKDES